MSKRRKTTKTRLPFVFLGILLIGLAFYFFNEQFSRSLAETRG